MAPFSLTEKECDGDAIINMAVVAKDGKILAFIIDSNAVSFPININEKMQLRSVAWFP